MEIWTNDSSRSVLSPLVGERQREVVLFDVQLKTFHPLPSPLPSTERE
jgi:hypothetical protein